MHTMITPFELCVSSLRTSMLIRSGSVLSLKDDPRGESRRKGTQKNKPLPKVRTNDIAIRRRCPGWAERQTFSDVRRRSPLPKPPLYRCTKSDDGFALLNIHTKSMCDGTWPDGWILPRQVSCTACHRNTHAPMSTYKHAATLHGSIYRIKTMVG